jgi:hypothetical protein
LAVQYAPVGRRQTPSLHVLPPQLALVEQAAQNPAEQNWLAHWPAAVQLPPLGATQSPPVQVPWAQSLEVAQGSPYWLRQYCIVGSHIWEGHVLMAHVPE